MNKLLIIAVIVVIIIIGLGYYFMYGMTNPDILLGVYKDPNNANNITIVKVGKDYFMQEVNGTKHLMIIKGNTVNVPDWGIVNMKWTARNIGPLTKI